MTYLGVDRKCRLPPVWRDNLDDTILAAFGCDLAHILHRISELLLGGVKARSIRDTKQTLLLLFVNGHVRLASAFDGR